MSNDMSAAARFIAVVKTFVGDRAPNRVARELKFPQRTLHSYVKSERPDPRVSSVEELAKKIGGYEAWQLLVPGFNPAHPPVLRDDAAVVAATEEERRLLAYYRSLGPEGRKALMAVRVHVDGESSARDSGAAPGESNESNGKARTRAAS